MFLDNLVQFSSAQAITTTAASTSIYDVTNAGSGNASNMIAGVNSTGATVVIGFDIGAGDGFAIPEVYWNVGTAFTAGGAATLTIQLQAAIDNGSNSPGTYATIAQTGALAVAALTAGTSGQIQVPSISPDMGFGLAQPRFYRLNYVVATGPFTAGTLSANLVLNPSQVLKIQNYPSNFVA